MCQRRWITQTFAAAKQKNSAAIMIIAQVSLHSPVQHAAALAQMITVSN